ncbi:MAG: flagellar basal body P-ring protein FlgI [Leptonema sp. (in: Bacteria)]|nr:flagellar basal body P-ring protein FlgI [Leptonema sp. (in: bacteria)]
MKRFIFIFVSLLASSIVFGQVEDQEPIDQENIQTKIEEGIRIKDLARIEGIRSNQLLGYGIVVGLQGTGDQRSKLALKSMQHLLTNLGQEPTGSLEFKNVAAVLVTAEIPPFAKKGDRVSVVVSSIGDAKSLEGGVLVQTLLQAGNGDVYAVAQGALLSASHEKKQVDQPRNVAVVPSGALIEKDLTENTLANRQIRIQLKDFDFTTLTRLHSAITSLQDQETKSGSEAWKDTKVGIEGGSVVITMPEKFEPVPLLSKIENLKVKPSYKARVVINQRTGTVVFGGEIQIDKVAISRPVTDKGQYRLKRQEAYQGIYVRSPNTVNQNDSVYNIEASSVDELTKALNQLGVTVSDIISILEALRDSGALHAEVVVL